LKRGASRGRSQVVSGAAVLEGQVVVTRLDSGMSEAYGLASVRDSVPTCEGRLIVALEVVEKVLTDVPDGGAFDLLARMPGLLLPGERRNRPAEAGRSTRRRTTCGS
jgi:hypothetical protein